MSSGLGELLARLKRKGPFCPRLSHLGCLEFVKKSVQGTAVLLVSPAAPLFPRHPAGLSSVEGHRQHVMELAPQPHHAAAVLWHLSDAPRLNFPTVLAMWEEGQHKREPHPRSI